MIPWPPLPGIVSKKVWTPPPLCLFAPLLLRMTDTPIPITAWAARTRTDVTPLSNKELMSITVSEYLIGTHNRAHIYLSPDPYGCVFDKTLDLHKWDLDKHHTGGLWFITKNGRLILASIDASSPGARIDKWHSRICGAWLQSIKGTKVSTLEDVHKEFVQLSWTHAGTCTLKFLHPEISPDISQHGLPIISRDDYFLQFTHNQLNNRIDLIKQGPPPCGKPGNMTSLSLETSASTPPE
jgi:hypothetical protein